MMLLYTRKCCLFVALFVSTLGAFAGCTLYTQPTIVVTSNQPDTICTAGASRTFTAAITGGGTSPVYQWCVNGVTVGSNTNTYSAVLHNNDLVYCRLTSNVVCGVPGIVTSNEIRMTVDAGAPITITPTVDCQGSPISLTGAGTSTSIVWYNGSTAFDTAIGTNNYTSIIRAGSNLDTSNQLNQLTPQGLWVDSAGNIYVSDSHNNRVLRFDKGSTFGVNGVIVAGGNGAGNAANQLNNPQGVYVDKQGNLFVCDYGNSRIQKFAPGSTQSTNGVTILGGPGYTGLNYNQLDGPMQVQKDDSGFLYVWDKGQNMVMRYSTNPSPGEGGVSVGSSLVGNPCRVNGMWVVPGGAGAVILSNITDQAVELYPPIYQVQVIGDIYTTIAGGNGAGSAANQLTSPAGIYFDGYGNLFVMDEGNGRVQMFTNGSNQNTNGTTLARGVSATNLWLDGANNVYVAETGNYRVRELVGGIGNDTVITPTAPGTYSAVVHSTGNCRTVTTATATVLGYATNSINTTICYGSHYTVGTNQYYQPGNYIDTLYNASSTGCDSIVTLHLQVDDNQQNTPQVFQNGNQLTAYTSVGDDTTYLWTVNGAGFTGDKGATITAPINGQYLVTGVDTNGCLTNSATYNAYNIEGIAQITNNYALSIQPNPANAQLTLQSQQAIGQPYSIYNVLGQQVTQGAITTNAQTINLSTLTPGIYLLQVKETVLRFAVER